MDHVSSLIPGVLKKRGLYHEAHAAMMVFRAKKWLAEQKPQLASLLQPRTFSDGILTVHSRNPEALGEAVLCAAELQAFLQAEGKYIVREVRCVAS